MKESVWTYVLKSEIDGSLYVGISKDVKRRIKEHNSGKTSSNRSKTPYILILKEKCENYREARKREQFWKSGFGREKLKQIG